MKNKFVLFAIILMAVFGMMACSVSKKTKLLRDYPTKAVTISALTDVRYDKADSLIPQSRKDELTITEEDLLALAEHDTLKNGDIVMDNVKDESTGEEMIVDKLLPSIVISRFAQRQERGGIVPIDFQIRVPGELVYRNWQVNLFPEIYLVNSRAAEHHYEVLQRDSLQPLSLNGRNIPGRRDRGYQRYGDYLKKYDRAMELYLDSLRFFDRTRYGIFMDRDFMSFGYSPERVERHYSLYYYFDKPRYDIFLGRNFTEFGYTPESVEQHYTNHILKNILRRIARGVISEKDRKQEKYIRYPYIDNALLDTVVFDGSDFVYDYTTNVSTKGKPQLNKALIYLDGAINHNGETVALIPRTDSLEYTISSIIDFVKDTVMHKVIYVPTHLDASSEYNILFSVGSRRLEAGKGNNAAQIAEIEGKIRTLMHNDKYLLDSIVVTATASPEGLWRSNRSLSDGRSESVMSYFRPFVSRLRDSLVRVALDSVRAEGMNVGVVLDYDSDGNMVEKSMAELKTDVSIPEIRFTSRSVPENWEKLAALMDTTSLFADTEKDMFFERMRIPDPDARENAMKRDGYYKTMKSELYPELRVVRFDFKLHLKETVNQRIVTDEIDELYMAGLDALKDRNWEEGIMLLRNGYPDDYNLGVAYLMMDRNENARLIFEKHGGEADADYMLAIADMRLGREKEALDAFVRSYKADPAKYWRGNRDPEIRFLINKYQLTQNNNEEY